MQEITALLITLTVLGATLRWLRRRTPLRGARRLELIETLPLATGRSLALVRVDEKRLVLAIGRDSVSVAAELPAVEPGAEPALRPAAKGAARAKGAGDPSG